MASIPGTLLRAFTILLLRVHGSVYIKRGRTGTCIGWMEHRLRSTTQSWVLWGSGQPNDYGSRGIRVLTPDSLFLVC